MPTLFDFEVLSRWGVSDPKGLLEVCDEDYMKHIRATAVRIADSVKTAPLLLLSGPSGSGKTTSAKKVGIELKRMGVRTHVLSMDNYFKTVIPETHPKDEFGNIDFESPECMDIALLSEHLQALAEGREILVPKFDFSRQMRSENRVTPLHLKPDEVAVVEGIHAFNPGITGALGDKAHKLYVSARSGVRRDGAMFYQGTWTRLTRRLIRDRNFRGSPPEQTLGMWASVRRGEKKYISPYKDQADIVIDTAHPYELMVMRSDALPLLERIPEGCERGEEWKKLHVRLLEFPDISQTLVAGDALVREFIGGGTIKY